MPDAAPTRVRHGVIGVCSCMAILLYLDRFCVSFAEAYIKEDLGLTATDISLMFGVFFVSYALGQTPAGWLADRFGGRRMLTLFILSWSVLTGLLGFANGILLLILLRLGMGFAQAGAFPAAASIISKWVPLTQRGVASSIVALGGRIGGALSLFITGYVILYFVPVSVESKFAPRDLLRADRLCYELIHGARPVTKDEGDGGVPGKLGERILGHFSPESRSRVAEAAAGYQRASRQASDASGPVGDRVTATLRDELLAGLNRVLAVPAFVTAAELGETRLEREAKRLLRADPTSLSAAQTERLNRLVLEAIYPVAIKKVYGIGWRQMTFLYGALGIPMALLFWVVCRDDPRRHPQCNEAEVALIEAGRPSADGTGKVGGLPLLALATNLSMWFNGAMQFFTNVGWVFIVTYLPRYLLEVHHTPVEERALMATLPTVAGIGGMFCGGFLADRMVSALGRRWGRSIPIAATRFAAGGAYLVCLFDPSPWTAVAALAMISFCCDLGIPAVWAFQQDVGGRHAGSVLGWGNMWGNFGAAAGPYMIGRLIDQGHWNAVFLASAGAFLLSGLASLGVNATKPVVRADEGPGRDTSPTRNA